MIDTDDVSWLAILWPTPGSWIGWAVFLAVICTMCAVAQSNEEECGQKKCKAGTAQIVDGRCLCVELAP